MLHQDNLLRSYYNRYLNYSNGKMVIGLMSRRSQEGAILVRINLFRHGVWLMVVIWWYRGARFMAN